MRISSHELHSVMNPYQAHLEQLDDEVRLEHYINDVLPLEKKARASQHIPYSMDVESFDRAEAMFIKDFFNGSIMDYNMWKKDNQDYLKGGD